MILTLIVGILVFGFLAFCFIVDLYYDIKAVCDPVRRPLMKAFWKKSVINFGIASLSLYCITTSLQFIFK